MSAWRPDVLGEPYEARSLHLADDDEGPVVATLVRYAPPAAEPLRAARVVLYVHGWSDYFFQTEVAEYWHGLGAAFYALDLRKYGRSLRRGQTPGYVADLATYDEDLDAAIGVIRRAHGAAARILVMAHSAGGLITALWADRHPGEVSAMVLNSPWLELQGSSVLRHVSAPAIRQIATFQPKAALPNIDPGFAARTVLRSGGGEWEYDETWKPTPSFPVRAGWLSAITAGHAAVAKGLSITAPILVVASTRSLISPRWSEEMRAADVVLDVELIARRAVELGPVVTLLRLEGALHDVALSAPPVRARFYAELDRWLAGYGWG